MNIKGYGFFTIIYLIVCLISTKILYRPARLVRLPIFMKYRSKITYGKGFTTGVGCRIDVIKTSDGMGEIKIGENVQINDYCHFSSAGKITIGSNVLIASKVFITDHDHGNYKSIDTSEIKKTASHRTLSISDVEIKSNVWIGEGVMILKGVTIGENAIIGANSVVTKSLPSNSLCIGSPARIFRKFK